MGLAFRAKELKLAGVFLMLYTFIVLFHLIKDLENGHQKEFDKYQGKIKLLTESKRSIQEYIGHIRNGDRWRAEDRDRLNAVLKEVLRNEDQNKEPLPVPVPIIHSPKRPQNKDGRKIAENNELVDEYGAGVDVIPPPGHFGAPVDIDPEHLSPEDKKMFDKGWLDHNFNQFVSDKIPLDRELPDRRHPKCSELTYDWRLPKMSVIICFHNEARSTLLRTVHSVLNRTPPHLLQEVILVDDFSDMEHLRANLTKYVATLPKVKVIRTSMREGLVRARLMGTGAAIGEVITFLDSHCECLEGWAEPLLARISENPKAVVWPMIPGIDKENFMLKEGTEMGVTQKGGFYWDMNFKWVPLTKEDKENIADVTSPVRSPTMAGGLFSITKKFFKDLGTYDPHFELWGGENMELSFKIWMCGGSLEILPCSVVGHVFRDSSPMHFNHTAIVQNSQRVAEIWLDEYKNIYYENIGIKLENIGELSSQIQLRRDLKCQSFDWYIKTIYPEVFLPRKALHRGKLHPVGLSGYCLDAVKKKAYRTPVRVSKCRPSITHFWYITEIGELRSGYECLDIGLDKNHKTVQNGRCHGEGGNQYWEYTQNQTLRKPKRNGCLTVNVHTKDVSLRTCDQSRSQIWYWEPFHS